MRTQSLTTSWKIEHSAKIADEREEVSPLLSSSQEQEETCVEDVSLSLEDGKLLAVVGRVASGKTSLLASLLGETHILSGSLTRRGRVAYVE